MEEKKVESIIFGLKETIAEQKAEIERLTEENAGLKEQVDELKERESSIIEYVENNVRNSCPKCKERTVKDNGERDL